MESQLKERFETIAQSSDQYPVDFDDAWQWIGYSTKQKGLEMLQANFEEGQDFLTLRLKSTGGRPSQGYFLTVDCFKSFCMMAGTERGKEVRKYYIAVEKALFGICRQEQDEWKKNFPYPFLLLEDAAIKMREMRLAMNKGAITVSEWRRVVLGDFSKYKPCTDVINFINENVTITGNVSDYILATDIFARYEIQGKHELTRHKLTRKIKQTFPTLVYKQKKINGSVVLCFCGCRLKRNALKEAANG